MKPAVNCLCICITVVAAIVSVMASEVRGEDLLPPPSDVPQQQIDPKVYEQFRKELQSWGCAELNELKEGLLNRLTTSPNRREQEYYIKLIGILNRERMKKCGR